MYEERILKLCIDYKQQLVADALKQKTYGQALKYLKNLHYDFDGNFRATLPEQILGLLNSVIDEAIIEVRMKAYKQLIDGDDESSKPKH
ncbi:MULTISPECIES: hypothetical protein [Lactobacillus]|uniref:hypothetical protein n=1 Tax=Lactobacillus TaxID=1578 RepID=UPI00119392E1|nr:MULTISPECIES: hypothetical protein [Lactobacillus]KAA9260144.1 hypothetical protein F6I24_01255 [Lactobacillus jensenii]MCW8106627.1 hypothetical protein [Lactobacillus mulieris]MCZ3741125.1 hypothetical protein [Lactobacillus mulieris]MCZ3744844.1 hypothetical protein [Lactobacillus mulieris]MCZ3747963.1 hypothetical protein [Lactobacillus mulieris]